MSAYSSDIARELAEKIIRGSSDVGELTKRSIRRSIEQELGVAEGALDEHKKEIDQIILEQFSKLNKDDDGAEVEAGAEEEEDEEDDGSQVVPTKKKSMFSRPYHVSDQLAAVIGVNQASRGDITKLLWVYIRANELQDPKDKRYIRCDAKMEAVMKTKRITFFKMSKNIQCHIFDAVRDNEGASEEDEDDEEEGDASDGEVKKQRPKRKKTEATSSSASKKKPAAKKSAAKAKDSDGPKKASGFQAPLRLSEELAAVLGTNSMSRPQVVKQIWVYIKEHNLQKASDKKVILCDEKLKKVLKCDSVDMFKMQKLLSPHFLGKDDGGDAPPAKSRSSRAAAEASEDDDDEEEEEEEKEEKPSRSKRAKKEPAPKKESASKAKKEPKPRKSKVPSLKVKQEEEEQEGGEEQEQEQEGKEEKKTSSDAADKKDEEMPDIQENDVKTEINAEDGAGETGPSDSS